jgi:hypothetical protein
LAVLCALVCVCVCVRVWLIEQMHACDSCARIGM